LVDRQQPHQKDRQREHHNRHDTGGKPAHAQWCQQHRGGPVQRPFDGFDKHSGDDLGPRITLLLVISLLYIYSQCHRAFLSGQIPCHAHAFSAAGV